MEAEIFTYEYTIKALHRYTLCLDIMGASRHQTITICEKMFNCIVEKLQLHPPFDVWKNTQISMDIDGYYLIINKGV